MRITSEDKYLESQGSDPAVVVPGSIASAYPHPQQPLPPQPNQQQIYHPPVLKRGLLDSYVLCLGLGFLGAHHFYLARPGFGLVYLLTFGLLGCGWVVDWFRLPVLVKRANAVVDTTQPRLKTLDDAYVLWFPMGLFGLHHFYLRKYAWGFLYLFTMGLFGIGWIIDGIRMKWLVEAANDRIRNKWPKQDKLSDAYILTLCPITGLLGMQHYYLNRIGMGVCYTLTLGFFGVGWLMDIVRMPFLVKEANKKALTGDDGKARLDDAYLFLFPLGFLGLHHFYLRRYMWGLLYLFTFGIFGVGWIIDFFRLPCLVKNYNQQIELNSSFLIPNPAVIQVPSGVVNPALSVPPINHNPGYGGVTGGSNQGPPVQGYPAQLPPYQPPYPAQYPQQGYPQQLPQGYPGAEQGYQGYPGYHGNQPDSLVTISSSEGDDPPSYSQATEGEESLQNSLNEQAASAPPLPRKE